MRIAAYLLVILMVGLGGLEPPTSPLSDEMRRPVSCGMRYAPNVPLIKQYYTYRTMPTTFAATEQLDRLF